MASVEWSDDAQEDLRKLDVPIARRIVTKALWFEENVDRITPEPLHGTLRGLDKFRAGDFRVIYSIHDEDVMIEAVRHRSQVYGR